MSDEEDFPIFTDSPDQDEEASSSVDGAKAQEKERGVAEIVEDVTKRLDDVCDCLFDEHLDVFEPEPAALIGLQVSARLMGKALGLLIQVSNHASIAESMIRSGLERGVARSLDPTLVCSREGRDAMSFVNTVAERLIRSMATATKTAVDTAPTEVNGAD